MIHSITSYSHLKTIYLFNTSVTTRHNDVRFYDAGLPHHFKVIFDSGASQLCTNNRSDFVPGTFRPSEHKRVQGIAVGLRMEGTGTLRWLCYDCTGQPCIITLEALLLPDLPIRLLSPQQLTKDQKNSFIVGSNETILLFQGRREIIRHGMTNNLPVSFCINATSQECSNSQVYLSTLFLKHTNDNLTEPQRRLLNIHRRLNHVDMQAIQRLYADDPRAKVLSSCPIPKCAECIFGT